MNGERIGEDKSGGIADALRQQRILQGDDELVAAFADELAIVTLSLDDVLIGNGRGERDLFLILSGTVSVQVEGGEIATRGEGDYVGEYCLIDGEMRRSANVVARDKTVVGCISESTFTALADKQPVLWRNLAVDLVRRLVDSQGGG